MKKVLLAFVFLLFAISANAGGFKETAAYVQKNGRLPVEYITKYQAKNLGWDASQGNLWDVAYGKSIGGDKFYNREGQLPQKRGRVWYEADIDYKGGFRNAKRLLFSSDGLIYKTTNHYKDFERME